MTLQALADFAHTAAEPPAQQSSQSHAFCIAEFGGDLVDAGVAGPEKVYRARSIRRSWKKASALIRKYLRYQRPIVSHLQLLM